MIEERSPTLSVMDVHFRVLFSVTHFVNTVHATFKGVRYTALMDATFIKDGLNLALSGSDMSITVWNFVDQCVGIDPK